MPVLSTRIVLDCFYLLIFYSEKFSTDVCRLPYAVVNVNLNLSNVSRRTVPERMISIAPSSLVKKENFSFYSMALTLGRTRGRCHPLKFF